MSTASPLFQFGSNVPPKKPGPATAPVANCENVLLIGGPGTGKSIFVRSISRAASQNPQGKEGMRFSPSNEAAVAASQEAPSVILEGKPLPPATREVAEFEARVELLRNGVVTHSCDLTLIDAPGGSHFPRLGESVTEDVERKLLEKTEKVSSVVLCVDSTDPQLDLLYTRIPEFLLKMRSPSGPGLRTNRVLVLLTKVDRLTTDFLEHSDPGATRYTAASLASWLDPIGEACHILGQELLPTIASAMDPRQTLAVGVCSALGFDAAGGQFYDERVKPADTPQDGIPAGQISRLGSLWGPRSTAFSSDWQSPRNGATRRPRSIGLPS